ncbi:unnamed protein product [Amoebophrya sp. A25]|nr:unnamed protein product [Amoebophrya sp. A25]|eukprot:GSA25T00020132001.1
MTTLGTTTDALLPSGDGPTMPLPSTGSLLAGLQAEAMSRPMSTASTTRPKSGIAGRRPRAVISPYDIFEDEDETEHPMDNLNFLDKAEPVSPRSPTDGAKRPGTSCSASAQVRFDSAARTQKKVEKAIEAMEFGSLGSGSRAAATGNTGAEKDPKTAFQEESVKVQQGIGKVEKGVEQVLERHKSFVAGEATRALGTSTGSSGFQRGKTKNLESAQSTVNLGAITGTGAAASSTSKGGTADSDDEKPTGGPFLVKRDLCPPEYVERLKMKDNDAKDMITINRESICAFAPQTNVVNRRLRSAERNRKGLKYKMQAREMREENAMRIQYEYEIKMRKAEAAEWRKKHMKPHELFDLVRPPSDASSRATRPVTAGSTAAIDVPATGNASSANLGQEGEIDDRMRMPSEMMWDIVLPSKSVAELMKIQLAITKASTSSAPDPSQTSSSRNQSSRGSKGNLRAASTQNLERSQTTADIIGHDDDEDEGGPPCAQFWILLTTVLGFCVDVQQKLEPPVLTPVFESWMKRKCNLVAASMRLRRLVTERRAAAIVIKKSMESWIPARTQWFFLMFFNRAVTIQRWWRRQKTHLKNQYLHARERFCEVERHYCLKRMKEMDEHAAKEKAQYQAQSGRNLRGSTAATSRSGGGGKEQKKGPTAAETEERLRYMMVPEEIRVRVLRDYMRFRRFQTVREQAKFEEKWIKDRHEWLLDRRAINFLGLKKVKGNAKAPVKPFMNDGGGVVPTRRDVLLDLVGEAHLLKAELEDGAGGRVRGQQGARFYMDSEDRVEQWLRENEAMNQEAQKSMARARESRRSSSTNGGRKVELLPGEAEFAQESGAEDAPQSPENAKTTSEALAVQRKGYYDEQRSILAEPVEGDDDLEMRFQGIPRMPEALPATISSLPKSPPKN